MLTFPIRVPALRVEQPLGTYYVAVLSARILLEVAYSDALSASAREDGLGYTLSGTQRLPQPKRVQPIADYINRVDSAFPNSIILAANFRIEDGLIEDDEWADDEKTVTPTSHPRWSIEEGPGGATTLVIPSPAKLAAVIDGQHRLFAFTLANSERLAVDLICSIFLDLPKPFQAQLFATINSTQKPVDKSLTYELFGYNIDEESELVWSPDKLAVFLTRKLNTDPASPLKGRIIIAPKRDHALDSLGENKSWKVSTAVIVEGIMRLFTSNPKKDTTYLLAVERKKRVDIAEYRKDRSPLRSSYINCQDAVIYTIVLNFLIACDKELWENSTKGSFITKTIGIQALFDILRLNAASIYAGRNISVLFFRKMLAPVAAIDFSSQEFRNASGSGRTLIRRTIEEKIDLGAPISA
jgi:DNA phosphorothioation-associated DGQHR protein 1